MGTIVDFYNKCLNQSDLTALIQALKSQEPALQPKVKATLDYVTGKGVIKNARAISVFNTGNEIGYFLGQPIYPKNSDKPWMIDSWAHPTNGQFTDIEFDATGTEFKITTVDGELILAPVEPVITTNYLIANTGDKFKTNLGSDLKASSSEG
jgi:hypothetical protein